MEAGELVLRLGDTKLVRVRVDRAETSIGSNASNDVVVPDESLPPVSAIMISFGAGRYKLRNMAPGAIKVNGSLLMGDEREVKHGDDLTFGRFVLHLQECGPEPTPPHIPGSVATEIISGTARGWAAGILTHESREYVLPTNRPFNIGTDMDCDLAVRDSFMSSFHCRIFLEDGRWTLSDLASTNGTTVNGLRLREGELPPVAILQFGHTTARFEMQGARPAKTQSGSTVYGGMVAVSTSMQAVFTQTQKLSMAPSPVLVQGPSGSGKELVARALHDMGARRDRPYLPLNCGALHATLIESELFGHEKGAFTGADVQKKGAFEACHGGTLFLDEVGELPLDLQPKLLRVLETSTIRRVGGTAEIPVDVRIVAATHRNLHELVKAGRFREDLFHRLYVLTIDVPPLRARPDDILPLARHFLDAQSILGRGVFSLTREVETKLLSHNWPGNVRELRNAVLRAVLTCEGNVIGPDDLQFSGSSFAASENLAQTLVRQADTEERARMQAILDRVQQNRAEAARLLGISKSTLHDRLKRLGIATRGDQVKNAKS